MSEQLEMRVSKGKLEPRGPKWQYWLGDKDHWVAYPDKKIAVTEMEDDHIQRTLTYLAGWPVSTVMRRGFYWEIRNGDGGGYGPFGTPTHRELMEKLNPCLLALEAEARRRGIEVPRIPGYDCPVEAARLEDSSKADAILQAMKRSRAVPARVPTTKPRRKSA